MTRIYKKGLSVLLSLALILTILPMSISAGAADTLYVNRKADTVFVIDATGSMGRILKV